MNTDRRINTPHAPFICRTTPEAPGSHRLLRLATWALPLILATLVVSFPTQAAADASAQARLRVIQQLFRLAQAPAAKHTDALRHLSGPTLQKGLVAADARGNKAQVVRILEEFVRRGVDTALYPLGVMYFKGDGVPKDRRRAFFLIQQSAQKGDPRGQGLLGSFYFDGEIVPRHEARAFYWWGLAAQQGNKTAQHFLKRYARSANPPSATVGSYRDVDISSAWVRRFKERDQVFEACERGDAAACQERERIREAQQRERRGMQGIMGLHGAMSETEKESQRHRKEKLYEGARERGYSAGEIVQ